MPRNHPLSLEPAERNPVKLWTTAAGLVVFMFVSALVIIHYYDKMAAEGAKDDRPALSGKLEKNFKVWRQDESEAGLLDLAGDVWVIAPVAFSQIDEWPTTLEVLHELKQRYAGKKDFHLVCLTVDPEGEPPAELKRQAEELHAELPGWWLAGAHPESVGRFLKNQLKGSVYPEKKNGKWVYDPALVVIDRNRYIRQATIRAKDKEGRELNRRNAVKFDFEQAAEWDREGRKEGIAQSNVETLKEILFQTTDRLLAEPVKAN